MKILQMFSDIVINAGIAHGFLFAVLFGRKIKHQSYLLLSFLLIDLSLIIFRIHYLSPYIWEKIGSQFLGSGPFIFLLGPLLYFYLRSVVTPEVSITRKDSIHLILFTGYLALIIPYFVLGKDSTYSFFLKRFIGSPWLFLILQFGYYMVKTSRLVKIHKKNIVEKYSNVQGMDVSWLSMILWIFIIIFLFITIGTPWLIHGLNLSSYYTTSALFFSLLLFFIAYRGIQQKVPLEPMVNKEIDEPSNNHGLHRLKEKLLMHMETNKPYLDPELTLIDLAEQVSISRNLLSQVINNSVGDNFYNFINKFRVEEVKELISKDLNRQYTILALAQDAGFNSKSSFNNIFKKITGLTPSQYRKGQM